MICELSHFYKLDVSLLVNIFQKWFKVTVEDNDEILYTNIYKHYISNLKKIKLKNNKDEVIARLKRRSSCWKRKRYYHQISPLITFCEKTYQISQIIYCKRLRENWTCGNAHTECPHGGWGDVASARSRLLPLCSNVIQVTEKFPCGFRYLVKRSDYLTRISKIAIQIIKEMRSQFIRNSFLSKRLQKQNFSFYFWSPRPYFLIHFSSAWGF